MVDLPDADRAARAGVPGGPEVDRYLRVDRLPPDLRVYAQDAVAGAVSRLDQAERLAEAVREGRALAVDAVSGSSYARVREFLFADASVGGQVGTTEQFAGTFAVLARAVGLPSRVVVGFRVPGVPRPVAPCGTCTARTCARGPRCTSPARGGCGSTLRPTPRA